MWEPLLREDLKSVDEIGNVIHTGLPERIEVLGEKRDLFPLGCFKRVLSGKIVGYGISHAWGLFSIPPLDSFLIKCPENPECIYVHDVALLSEARGYNAAGEFIAIIKKVSRDLGIPKLACVSVYGTDVLWSRFGFSVVLEGGLEKKLESYGATAKYMISDVFC